MKKVLIVSLLLGSMSAKGMNLNDKLIEAAREGRSHRVKLLIEGGADVNYANKDDFTALTYAAARGHYKSLYEN